MIKAFFDLGALAEVPYQNAPRNFIAALELKILFFPFFLSLLDFTSRSFSVQKLML